MASIIAKKEIAKGIYKAASDHHYALYQQQQELKGIVDTLEQQLKQLIKRDRELNQARGKRQRRTRHKKGKKR